jgi:hypothetical protein
MGLLDKVFGRKADMEPEKVAAGTHADARAVADYERMLRTAPPDVLERAHAEAFEKLTPAQLDLLLERFTATASAIEERPADAKPKSLAKWAAGAERRQPGAIARALGLDQSGAGLTTLVGASILDAIIWYSIASVAWNTWSSPGDDPSVDSAGGGSQVDSAEAVDSGGSFLDFGI